MVNGAVITADIVNSTLLSTKDGEKLIRNLQEILQGLRYEFFRGDSFQVWVPSPGEALSLVLRLRTRARMLSPGNMMPTADIRASVGIGGVRMPLKSLNTATDEAFILSGRAFDKMGKEQRLVIACTEKNEVTNLGLGVIAHFIDYLFKHLTTKQAFVVSELLMHRTQTETARRLNKSQATINKHAQSAGWPEMERLLRDYQLLVASIKSSYGNLPDLADEATAGPPAD